MVTHPIYVSIPQPFDLDSTLHSGQAHRWSAEDGWNWGVVRGNLIKIRKDGGDSSAEFQGVELASCPVLDSAYLESLLHSYFRLGDDIEAIYQDITRDPRVAIVVPRHRGLRLLSVEPWECLISFICSANSNIPRIHTNMEVLSESFGRALELDGHIRYTFPEPDRLAGAGDAALRKLGLGFRAPYVANAALEVAEGKLDLESLGHMPYPEAKSRLMELPGVGPKIADCVLLHSLDKLEAFPVDVWVRRALREWYFDGQKVPDRTLWEWAQEYFGRYAGYAELYLFHGRRLESKNLKARAQQGVTAPERT